LRPLLGAKGLKIVNFMELERRRFLQLASAQPIKTLTHLVLRRALRCVTPAQFALVGSPKTVGFVYSLGKCELRPSLKIKGFFRWHDNRINSAACDITGGSYESSWP
jgi:hypothetical protein